MSRAIADSLPIRSDGRQPSEVTGRTGAAEVVGAVGVLQRPDMEVA